MSRHRRPRWRTFCFQLHFKVCPTSLSSVRKKLMAKETNGKSDFRRHSDRVTFCSIPSSWAPSIWPCSCAEILFGFAQVGYIIVHDARMHIDFSCLINYNVSLLLKMMKHKVPESDSHSTRAGSAFRTKGGVAVGFSIFGTSLLFVNCHLPAHAEKFAERERDLKKILFSLDLPKELPIRKKQRGKREPHVFY